MTDKHDLLLQKPLTRNEYLQVVQAGLVTRQYSFSRQAVLNWLATYPGDLQAGLFYAQALIGERRLSPATQVLQGLCFADPEYEEAIEAFLDVIKLCKEDLGETSIASDLLQNKERCGKDGPVQVEAIESSARAQWFALHGSSWDGEQSASWGEPLWFARQAFEQGDLPLAKELIDKILGQEPVHPLIDIVHLRILGNDTGVSQDYRYGVVSESHQRWPDTLEIALRLADWSLERGESDFAVALLHQAAARDVAGQVVQRLWGADHPFRSLWPEKLELKLKLMVPAIVMAWLGWNRLPSKVTTEAPLDGEDLPDHVQVAAPVFTPASLKAEGEGAADQRVKVAIPEPSPPLPAKQRQLETSSATPALAEPHPNGSRPSPKMAENEMRAVEREIEKLAARFKLKGVTRQDGRFPVYVIFSLRCRLQSVYGREVSGLIENEMQKLAEAVSSRPGWGARTFFADDAVCADLATSKPAKPDDPWSLKLALADLDNALAKRGERIGAVLIVGGPEVVPFHLLPNPVDDPDGDVPSDNPYAARDKNYFIPEWPVGRLPGGSGKDARLLLQTLRRYQVEHLALKRRLPLQQRFLIWIARLWKDLQPAHRRVFGYSAEIWHKAAGSVFRPIGLPGWMHISPPSGLPSHKAGEEPFPSGELTGIPVPTGKLGYFNLHGLIDAAEWFGHRDPSRSSSCPDYPVALRPEDIQSRSNKGGIPRIIFSEACYGMHIQGRALDEAISLKFLEAGTLAIAGSTCMAYGSIDANPMMAADLLGHTFWRFLKSGMPAGEAMRQAKIYLACEMNQRQGYLDGEDQKTLISFILYGDPLAEPFRKERVPGSVRYQNKPLANVRTVSDRVDSLEEAGPVPAEVMDGVRQVVAKYLPGMMDARLAYVCENESQAVIEENGHSASEQNAFERESARGDLSGKAKRGLPSLRNLVTLSKQVARQGGVHPEIARLTLDEDGHLMKLVVSR